MKLVASVVHPSRAPDSFWQSLHYFNLYRLIIAGVFVVSFSFFTPWPIFDVRQPDLFFLVALAYAMIAALLALPISSRWPAFQIQLTVQLLVDILCLVLLIYAGGGVQSGLGVLLIVSLAAAGWVGEGRQVMLLASVASILLLLQQLSVSLAGGGDAGGFILAGLVSMGMFATAGVTHILTRKLRLTEQAARRQRLDLASLAQVNQRILEEMSGGVVVVDGALQVRQINAPVWQLLGQPPRPQVFLQDLSPDLARALAAWQERGEAVSGGCQLVGTEGMIRAEFVPVHAGAREGALIFLEDLSRLEAQAQQIKLAALGRLTANLAHEIRNPLSAISHAGQLLQEEVGQDPAVRRLTQIIGDNTVRLDRMVKEILYLNRLDKCARTRISLAPWLADFAATLAEVDRLPPGSIRLTVQDARPLLFDESQLNQVLWNLCRNAWRHSRQGPGSIHLHVHGGGRSGALCLDVVDDGPGVEAAHRSKLFEPFFTTTAEGSGLGLYVAREITEANGAELAYVARDGGGLFRITSREAACPENTAKMQQPSGPAPGF